MSFIPIIAILLGLGSLGPHIEKREDQFDKSLSTVSEISETGSSIGKCFYVALNGNDNNSGTSKDAPWKSIEKVNAYGKSQGFQPGDIICFKGGDVFNDAVLDIVNSGTENASIVFSSYGEGKAHLTRSGIDHDEIIRVLDQKYFTIENLEISSPDFDMSKVSRGIRIEFTQHGEYPGITIRNNYIHDIHGGMWTNRHIRGGIWMRCRKDIRAYTVDMLVENNHIERCHTRGMKLDSEGTDFHKNMVVRNNYVDNTGQAGIVIGHVEGGLIEGNTVFRAGNYYPPGDQAGVLAACWAAHSKNIIIQNNEVAYTRLGDVTRPDGNLNEMSHDSQAFDIDVTAPGWHLIQYNYTHDNEGGFFLWMGKPGPDFEWAVIRYNLSVNDGKGFNNRLFELHSHQDNNYYPVYVYNNTFVNDERIWINNRTPDEDKHKGWKFENNIFYAPEAQYDDQTTITYNNNLYWPDDGPRNDLYALKSSPEMVNPVNYDEGWESIDNFKLKDSSPAIGKAFEDTSRSTVDPGKRDLFGTILPGENRSLGAHEPRGVRRYALGQGFEGRARLLIEEMSRKGVELNENYGGGKNGAFPAMTLFATGEITLGKKFVQEQMNGGGAMFREYGTMVTYMKYGELYGSELRENVKDNQLNHSVLYKDDSEDKLPGGTENHKLMYAAANYLGGLAWPEEYPEKWCRAGYDYLMRWFDLVHKIGYHEEDSPTYFVHHVGPIHSVWENAPEGSEMKMRAKMILDWYFASVAPEYLNGYWIATYARDMTPVHGLDLPEESAAVLWLYFARPGQRAPHPNPTPEEVPFRQWMVTAEFALSDYRPPSILRKIAQDRDEVYVHKEYMKKNSMEPRDYLYMNKSYGLASTLDESGIIPEDMTRWKLQWETDEIGREPSTFILKHPYLYRKIKDKWQDWRGASPYEKVLQKNGALMTVYGIPDEDKFPFIDGPFNKDAYDRIKECKDWWFFENDAVLFGVYVANGFQITGEKRMSYQHFGKTAEVDVIMSKGRRNAVIIQTALPEEYPADSNESHLDAFADDVIKNTRVKYRSGNGKFPELSYTTLEGDVLYINKEGERTINKKPLITEDWPLLGNPWMHQEINEGILTINYGTERLIYDFKNWEIRSE